MVERFILVDRHWSEGSGGYMEPDDQGDWVRYSDLAAAHAEIERLTKERDEARAQAKHMEGFDRCTCAPCPIHPDAALRALKGERE